MDNVLYDSFVGIDIAKLKFDVAVCLADKKVKYKTFDNNPKGYEAFHQWLMQFGKQPLTLMEATGIYHEALADFLYANGVAVAVINPKCTPNIAKSANIRSKTDQTDAKLLAEFARKNADDVRLYQPRPAAERELLLKTRQLEHLKRLAAQETVRIQTLTDADSITISKQLIQSVKQYIKDLEKMIKSLIRQDEDLKRNAKLLASIPGIGDQSVWCLLGHLGNGQRFRNGKAAATFFGLTPMVKQSGSSVYTVVGISKIGHSDVRKTLYMPAVSFSFGRWANGPYAPFVTRLLKSGKSKNTIIVALMRKLVTIAQSVLKHQKPFDPALLNQQS